MCVIIYVPIKSTIDKEELEDAWTVNGDGAGYAYRKNGRVYFKRGFMDFDSYYKAIRPLIGAVPLLLHLRISTSTQVNRVQTHPYKKGNITLTEGVTTRPVICMNGVIHNQNEYKDCNDTMSYIIDHQETFANITQDILNIIEDATTAKWAVMLPDKTLLSKSFFEEDGVFYSNTNHKSYFRKWSKFSKGKKQTMKTVIPNKKLRDQLKKNKQLYTEVMYFIDDYCSHGDFCSFCLQCFKQCNSIPEVEQLIEEKYYGDGMYYY